MENNERKNNSLTELMEASMSKIRDMVDSNTIIGEPIQTPDGVTLIPVSRLSFGFGCGGGDYGKQAPKFGGASTAGVKGEPVAFLVVKDGVTRVMPVALPAVGTVDRVIDLVPQVMDRVESFIDKKKAEKETYCVNRMRSSLWIWGDLCEKTDVASGGAGAVVVPDAGAGVGCVHQRLCRRADGRGHRAGAV